MGIVITDSAFEQVVALVADPSWHCWQRGPSPSLGVGTVQLALAFELQQHGVDKQSASSRVCYTATMPDTARHDAPQPGDLEIRHTLTVRDVEVLFANAGVQRSHRHVLRLCQSAMLDAVKIPGGPSGEEWYVAPASVPKAIGDLKQIDAQRARRGALQPAAAEPVAVENPPTINPDAASHTVPQRDASDMKNNTEEGESQPAAARYGVTDLDIYEHPYVKRLEATVDKLEAKYDAQVRRTEEIQLTGQKQLLELQRMTAVGQSQTLADFMLKAKDWILGPGDPERREADTPPMV